MEIALVHAAAAIAGMAVSVEQPLVTWVCWEGENVPLTNELRDEYQKRFATCTVDPARKSEVESIITRIMKSRGRYELVTAQTGVPWYIIAVIHNRECSGDFRCHLHNGDPLSARTVHVPKNRPDAGAPPFKWETSAIDAMRFDGFDVWTNWSVAGTLFKLEAFNGLGPRNRGIATGYLWSGCQHYVAGKYVRDGVWDPKFVDKQIGAAVVLRRMADQALIDFGAPRPAASAPGGAR